MEPISMQNQHSHIFSNHFLSKLPFTEPSYSSITWNLRSISFFSVFSLGSVSKPLPVFIVDYSCLKPPGSCRLPFSSFLENASAIGFDKKSVTFMSKILITSSGQSEEACLPPALHFIPPKTHHSDSITEVEMLLFIVVDDRLAKTNLSPLDIDMLITNCSGFCPVPSLSSIIISNYSMRSDVRNYHLSGMGCSASAIGIDLANNLLSVRKNSNAIVISTKILSTGWYPSEERSKLILNCLFRMASAAILLSNKKEGKKYAKYKVTRTLRIQISFGDRTYFAAFREEDSQGKLRVTLKGDVVSSSWQSSSCRFSLLIVPRK